MRNTGQSAGKRWDKWQEQQKDIRKTQRRKFLGFRYVFAELMRDLKNDSSVSTEIKSSIDEFDWE